VLSSNLDAENGRLAAKTHGSNSQGIGFFVYLLLQSGQLFIGIFIIEFSKKQLLRLRVRRTAVAADGYPQHTRCAALALGILDSIEYNASNAIKISTSFQPSIRQLVLGRDIFTTSCFFQSGCQRR